MLVFEDPNAVFEPDGYGEPGEQRWHVIGVAGGLAVILVVHTTRDHGDDEIVRIVSARRTTRGSEVSMNRVVRKTLTDVPLTPTRKRRLSQLAALPDSEIDFSDIPELTGSFWKNAIRNPYYRPVKQQLTVRLDSDIVAWLRKQGKGYQTRLNGVLRDAMLNEVKKSA